MSSNAERAPLVRVPSKGRFQKQDLAPLGDGGSYFFLSNIIAGPGMLALPLAFQEGGWCLTTLFTLGFTALSVLCAAYVVKAVQFYRARTAEQEKLKQAEGGSEEEDKEEFLEIETLVRACTTDIVWFLFQITFILSMIMMAVSSIHVVVRAVDDLCILCFKNTYALQVLPLEKFGFVISCPELDSCAGVEAFYEIDSSRPRGYIITLGYLLTLAIAVPFSIIEIVDWCQGIMYTISLVCVLEMIADFAFIADDSSFRAANGMTTAADVPPWGYNVGLVIEVSFLTWCLSFSVPMWLEQTADGVSINAALWWSCLSRGVLFIAFGFVAAGAFDDLDTMNVLDVLRTHTAVKPITQVCGFLFAVTCVFPNILAHSAAVRRNLEAHIGTGSSNWIGVGVPWGIAWLFYFGAEYNVLVNTSSIYLNGVIQFLLPAFLFLAFSALAGSYICRVAGIRASMDKWQEVTRWVAALLCLLIVAAYVLNFMVRTGVYGPNHVNPAAAASASADYGDGESYAEPPPPTAAAPAPAPPATS